MVIDTSALVAILTGEPEQTRFIQAISGADQCLLSTANWVETSIVVETRYGPAGLYYLDRLLAQANIETAAVDAKQAHQAHEAYQRYGKGRHPAALNFGDCFSYALAATRSEPLLFKGNDFAQTDIAVVDVCN